MKKFIAIAIIISVLVSVSAFMMNTVSDSDVSGVTEYRDNVMLVMTRDEYDWMTFTKYTHVIGDRYVNNGFVALCGSGNTTAESFEFAWEAIS